MLSKRGQGSRWNIARLWPKQVHFAAFYFVQFLGQESRKYADGRDYRCLLLGMRKTAHPVSR
jgi:hypothetical protein